MSAETLSVGVTTTLIGMGVVFAVLILLALVTGLVGSLKDGKEAAKKAAPAPQPAAVPAAQPAAAGKVDAKTAAIVMAAVSAFCGKPISALRFNSIKRAGGVNSAWSASGTADIINTRQQYL